MSSQSSGDVRRPRIPHVYVLIFGLIVLTAVLRLLLPAGSYDRDAEGRVIDGTFAAASTDAGRPDGPRGFELVFAVFEAPLEGIRNASAVIAFILMVGGAFKVMEQTRAFETALRGSVRYLGRAEYVIIPVAMLLFSVGGATLGMSEEILPYVLLFVPLVRMLGYHSVVGVAVPLVGSQMGLASAMLDPSSVGTAQGIAGLPPFSGWELRTVLWLAATAVGILFVTLQARRWGYDTETLDPDMMVSPSAKVRLTRRQVLVLATLAAGLGAILWGTERYGWRVTEIGAVFVAVGVVAGIAGRLSASRIARCFVAGARDLAPAALVVGVARGIVVLADDVRILDPVLHHAAGALGQLHGVLALHLMFLFHGALNFFLPSSSDQAAFTLPVMAPLAGILGLTRQMAVLAFQLGDAFTNMIVPTSAVLMGSLEAAKVSYERWFAFAWRLQIWLLVFGVAALSIAYGIGFGP